MGYVAALLAAAGFMAAVEALGVLPITSRVIATSRGAAAAVRDPGLDDDDKERLMRQASLTLLAAGGGILWRTALALLAAAVPLLVMHATGLVEVAAVGDLLMTWQGITLTAAVMTAVSLIRRR